MNGSGEGMRGRAVWFPGARQAEVRTEDVAAPGPGEILVRSTVSLISAGTELVVYRGDAADDDPMPLYSEGDYGFPVKYGYQVVGVVEQAGAETALPAGTRVFVRHPHQDLFTVRVEGHGVVPLPDDVDDESAAMLNLTRVATTAIWDAPTAPGDVVAVYGQGVVGALCARLARRNAGAVIAVDPVATRRERALKSGVDAAVPPEQAAQAVAEFSDGRGADVVYETSGAGAALQSAIDCAGEEATVCVVSYYGRRPVPLRLAPQFHWRRLRLVSSHQSLMSYSTPRWSPQRRNSVVLRELNRLNARDLISARVPLADAARAYRLIEAREDDILGVLLTYPGERG